MSATLIAAPAPTVRAVPAAFYKRLVDDTRENLRAALRSAGIERNRRLIRRALLDAYLAESASHDALHRAVGHLRDAEAHAPGSEAEADCINDFAAAAHEAAREYGRNGEN